MSTSTGRTLFEWVRNNLESEDEDEEDDESGFEDDGESGSDDHILNSDEDGDFDIAGELSETFPADSTTINTILTDTLSILSTSDRGEIAPLAVPAGDDSIPPEVQAFPLALPLTYVESVTFPDAIQQFLSGAEGASSELARPAVLRLFADAASSNPLRRAESRRALDELARRAAQPDGQSARELLLLSAVFATDDGEAQERVRHQLELIAQRQTNPSFSSAIVDVLVDAIRQNPNGRGVVPVIRGLGSIAQHMGQSLNLTGELPEETIATRSLGAVTALVNRQDGTPLSEGLAGMLFALIESSSETLRGSAGAALESNSWSSNQLTRMLRQRHLEPATVRGIDALVSLGRTNPALAVHVNRLLVETLNDNSLAAVPRVAADYDSRRALYSHVFRALMQPTLSADGASPLNVELLNTLRGSFTGTDQEFVRQIAEYLTPEAGREFASLLLNSLSCETDTEQDQMRGPLLPHLSRIVTPEMVRNFQRVHAENAHANSERYPETWRSYEQAVTEVMLGLLNSPAREEADRYLSTLSIRHPEYRESIVDSAIAIARSDNPSASASAAAFLARAGYLTNSDDQVTRITRALEDLGRTDSGLATLINIATTDVRPGHVALSVLRSLSQSSPEQRGRVLNGLLRVADSGGRLESGYATGHLRALMNGEGAASVREFLANHRDNRTANSLLVEHAPHSVADGDAGRFIADIVTGARNASEWSNYAANVNYLSVVTATGRAWQSGLDFDAETTDAAMAEYSEMALHGLRVIAESPENRESMRRIMTNAYLENSEGPHNRLLLEQIISTYASDSLPADRVNNALRAIASDAHHRPEAARLLAAIAGGATGNEEFSREAQRQNDEMLNNLYSRLDLALENGHHVEQMVTHISSIPNNDLLDRLDRILSDSAPEEGVEGNAAARSRYQNALEAILIVGGPAANHQAFAETIASNLSTGLQDRLRRVHSSLSPETRQALSAALVSRLSENPGLSFEQRRALLATISTLASSATRQDIDALTALNLMGPPAHGPGTEAERLQLAETISSLAVTLLSSSNQDIRSSALDFVVRHRDNELLSTRLLSLSASRTALMRTLLRDETTRVRALELISDLGHSNSRQWLSYAAGLDPRNLEWIANRALTTGRSYIEFQALIDFPARGDLQREHVLNALSNGLRGIRTLDRESASQAAGHLVSMAESDSSGATSTWLRQQLEQSGGENLAREIARVALTSNIPAVRSGAQSLLFRLAREGQLTASTWNELVLVQAGLSSSNNRQLDFLAAIALDRREVPSTTSTVQEHLAELRRAASAGNRRALELIAAMSRGHEDQHRNAALVFQQLVEGRAQPQRDELVRLALELTRQNLGSYLARAVANIAMGQFREAPASHAAVPQRYAEAVRALRSYPGDRLVFTPFLTELATLGYPEATQALIDNLPGIPRTAVEQAALFRAFVSGYHSRQDDPAMLSSLIALGRSESPSLNNLIREESIGLLRVALETASRQPEHESERQRAERSERIREILNAFITEHNPTWLSPGDPRADRLQRGLGGGEQEFLRAAPIFARLLEGRGGAMNMSEFQTLQELGLATPNLSVREHVNRFFLQALSPTQGASPQVQRAAFDYFYRHGFLTQNAEASRILRDYVSRTDLANPLEASALNDSMWTMLLNAGTSSTEELRVLAGMALGRPAEGDRNQLALLLRNAAREGNNRAILLLGHVANRINTSSTTSAQDRQFGARVQSYLTMLAGMTDPSRVRVLNILSSIAPTSNSFLAQTTTELRRAYSDYIPPLSPPATTASENTRVTMTTDADGRRVVTESTSSGLPLLSTTYSGEGDQSTILSRTQFTYLTESGELTFDPTTAVMVSATTTDATGRVVERLTYSSLEAQRTNCPRLRETVSYTTDATSNSVIQTRQSFDLSNPDRPVSLGTVTRTQNTRTGETTVVSRQTVNGTEVNQTVTYGRGGQLLSLQRREGRTTINYTIANGAITGATINGAPVDAARREQIIRAGRQVDADTRLLEAVPSPQALDSFTPTTARMGTSPTGTLVFGEPSGDSWTLRQARVVNGVILGADGLEIGRVSDTGEVSFTGGRSFNILNEESAAFHGIGSDGMRLDLVAQSRIRALSGTLTSPDRTETVVVVGGNLFNREGQFLGRIDQQGNITAPTRGTEAFAVQLNSQFEGWTLNGIENDRVRIIPMLSSGSANGRFFYTPPGGSRTEFLVRMGAVINRETGEQVGLMSTPIMDGYRYVQGGSIEFFNADRTGTAHVALEDMRHAVFDLRVSAPTGTEPLRMQFVSLGQPRAGSTDPSPYFGRLFSLAANQGIFEREIERLGATGSNTYSARSELSYLTDWFNNVLSTGYVYEPMLNEYLNRAIQLETSAMRLDQNHRFYRIGLELRDSDPLPSDVTALNGSISIPRFGPTGTSTGTTRLRIANGRIMDGDTDVGTITHPDGRISLNIGGREYRHMAELEGAVWTLNANLVNYDRISTGFSILTRSGLRAAGSSVQDYFSSVANAAGSTTAARNRRDAATTLRNGYHRQVDQMFTDGIQTRQQLLELGTLWRSGIPSDARREPPSIQPLRLTADSATQANGRLRIGSELYEVRNGALYLTTTTDGRSVTASIAVGRLGADYVINWTAADRQPTNLADRQRVLFTFRIGTGGAEHNVIGLGPARMTHSGMVSGGLVNEAELTRQVRAAHEAAVRGDISYFRDRPWITGGLTNWMSGNPERVMRNLLASIGQNRVRFNDRLGSLFTDGFNPNFSNADIDSRIGLVEVYQNAITSTAASSRDLTQMVGALQRQVSESAAMAVLTIATAGIGTAFNAGRLGLAAQNLSRAGIRLAPQVVARGVQEGLLLTRVQRAMMLGGELATSFGAGGLTSVAFRGSESANLNGLFLSGGVEGLTMNIGHHFQTATQAWNFFGRSGVSMANAVIQSTAFAGAQVLRDGNAENFNLTHIGIGSATMLLARPFQALGVNSSFARGVTEALAFGGMSGVLPGLESERDRIEAQLGLPRGSLSMTSLTFLENMNLSNVTTSIAESAAWAAVPVATASGASMTMSRLVRPRQATPGRVNPASIPHELLSTHSDLALCRAAEQLAGVTRNWGRDLRPHAERLNQYTAACNELRVAIEAEATRTGRSVAEIQRGLESGTGSRDLLHLSETVREYLGSPQVAEFQARLEALQTAVNEAARQNGHSPVEIRLTEGANGSSAFNHGRNRLNITAHDLLHTDNVAALHEALTAGTAQQSADALVVRALVEEIRRSGADMNNQLQVMSRLQELFQTRTGFSLDSTFATEVLSLNQSRRPLNFNEVARANLLARNMLAVRSIFAGETAFSPVASRMIEVLSRITDQSRHGAIIEMVASMDGSRSRVFLEGIEAMRDTTQAAAFLSELSLLSGTERNTIIDTINDAPTVARRRAVIEALIGPDNAVVPNALRYLAQLSPEARRAAIRELIEAESRARQLEMIEAFGNRESVPPTPSLVNESANPPRPSNSLNSETFRRVMEQISEHWSDLTEHSSVVQQYVRAQTDLNQLIRLEALRQHVAVEQLQADLAAGRASSEILAAHRRVRELSSNPIIQEVEARRAALERSLADTENGSPIRWRVELGDLGQDGTGLYQHGSNRIVISAVELLDPANIERLTQIAEHEAGHRTQDRAIIRMICQELEATGTSINTEQVRQELRSQFRALTGFELNSGFANEVIAGLRNTVPLSPQEMLAIRRTAESLRLFTHQTLIRQDRLGIVQREISNLRTAPESVSDMLDQIRRPERRVTLFGEENPAWVENFLERADRPLNLAEREALRAELLARLESRRQQLQNELVDLYRNALHETELTVEPITDPAAVNRNPRAGSAARGVRAWTAENLVEATRIFDRANLPEGVSANNMATMARDAGIRISQLKQMTEAQVARIVELLSLRSQLRETLNSAPDAVPAGSRLNRQQWQQVADTLDHFLRHQQTGLNGRQQRQAFNTRIEDMTALLRNISSPDFPIERSNSLVEIFTASRNLPSELPVSIGRLNQPNVDLVALERYATLARQLNGISPGASPEQQIQWQAVRNIMRTFAQAPDAQSSPWTFLPTTGAEAHSAIIDGYFINLESGELRPVSLRNIRNSLPWELNLQNSDLLQSRVPYFHWLDIEGYLIRTRNTGLSPSTIEGIVLPGMRAENSTLPEMRNRLEGIRARIRELEAAREAVPQGLRILAGTFERGIANITRPDHLQPIFHHHLQVAALRRSEQGLSVIEENTRINLNEGPVSIGSRGESIVYVDSEQVNRNHATINRDEGGIYLENLSSNVDNPGLGTWVRVGQTWRSLRPGERVYVRDIAEAWLGGQPAHGGVRLALWPDVDTQPTRTRINDMTVSAPERRQRSIEINGVSYPLRCSSNWLNSGITGAVESQVKVHVTITDAADLARVQQVLIPALANDPVLRRLVGAWKTMDPFYGTDQALSAYGQIPNGLGQGAKGFTIYCGTPEQARQIQARISEILRENGLGLRTAPNTGNVESLETNTNRVGLVREAWTQADHNTQAYLLDEAVHAEMHRRNSVPENGRLTAEQLAAIERDLGLVPNTLMYDNNGRLALTCVRAAPHHNRLFYAPENGYTLNGLVDRPALYRIYRHCGIDPTSATVAP
ncbi:MAG: hypothetical protein K2X93_00690 [Candidatus Obscuribacterales bacterium]|nr:hypothetical protein [Candidatus Obscuribacterales bacterium]